MKTSAAAKMEDMVATVHGCHASQVGWLLVNGITKAIDAHENGDHEKAARDIETCAALVAILADKLGSATAKGTMFEAKEKSATE